MVVGGTPEEGEKQRLMQLERVPGTADSPAPEKGSSRRARTWFSSLLNPQCLEQDLHFADRECRKIWGKRVSLETRLERRWGLDKRRDQRAPMGTRSDLHFTKTLWLKGG